MNMWGPPETFRTADAAGAAATGSSSTDPAKICQKSRRNASGSILCISLLNSNTTLDNSSSAINANTTKPVRITVADRKSTRLNSTPLPRTTPAQRFRFDFVHLPAELEHHPRQLVVGNQRKYYETRANHGRPQLDRKSTRLNSSH